MRASPSVSVLVGTARLPLNGLSPERVEVLHRINSVPSARVVLTVQGNPLRDIFEDVEAEVARCAAGEPVSLMLLDAQEREHLIFKGVIEQQTMKADRERTELTLRLRHDLEKLRNSHRSQVFQNMSQATVVGSLLAAQQIPATIADMDLRCEQLVQFGCSDWRFIRERLSASGVWAFPSPERVVIAAPGIAFPTLIIRQHALFDSDHVLMEDASWSFSERAQPEKLKTSTWDDHEQRLDTVSAKDVSLGTGAFDSARGNTINREPWQFSRSAPLGLQRTTALSHGLMLSLQAGRASGEFRINGTAEVDLGDTVSIEGYGKAFDGDGIVTAVRHHIDREAGWRTTLTLGCDDMSSEDVPPAQINGLHIGVVKSFKKDTGGMNRLQVHLPVLGDNSDPLWARLAKPYASDMSGFCFYPEPGDEVIVGFLDGDPSFPVIIGSMHNPKNRAPIDLDAKNDVKALIVGKQGMSSQLLFDSGEQRVDLSSPQEQLVFKKGCKLMSGSGLALTSNQLKLSGASSVSVESMSVNFDQKSTPPKKS
ncbi:phage baseplate assembly protein V [Caballeronia sp. LZ032]|uniref:phage baseplate assembly protein V n=1 Tax=Caballeronia sp. LZ032 TaxID=3038565 RepID=UPI002861E92F|nr:phage baseplate assembly protein V [Caballeronia sp. LZ032]MDR5881224.1 phage baseplate assembly protein V [Caballeronia sp. LZ032]